MGGGGKNEALNRKFTWEHACFGAFMFKIYMKAQKHACFHVFPHLVPPYIIMVKGVLTTSRDRYHRPSF